MTHSHSQPDTNPSLNAVTGSSGTHPVPEGAADNAPPAIREAMEQIAIICTDNMGRSCDHRMALDFVRQIANDYLDRAHTQCGVHTRDDKAWPSDSEMLSLLAAAGFDPQLTHPSCYYAFSWKTFTEKLRAALSLPETAKGRDWQSIETAPKDGTPVLVCNSRHPTHAPVVVRWLDEMTNPDTGWCDAATASGDALYFNCNYFDLWMPPPSVPSARCGCLACTVDGPHSSDCAVHNPPAFQASECTCSVSSTHRGSDR